MYRFVIFLLLFGTWIIFSGRFDSFHLTLGLLSSLFITLISSSFLFTNRSKSLGARLGEVARLPAYLLWLMWEIVLSNIHILKLALTPGEIKDLDPSLVRIKTKLKTDFGKYALANSITLTPGTITIDVDGDELLIHSISKHTADGVKDDTMENKIAQVFEGGEG
ncbi:MAG: Na+/H+ antiporter subunit E [Verrucomicrobia bacterium]|nr:Na+/H+ antiporter subunit E [Verrucomicrobiota bacterium]